VFSYWSIIGANAYCQTKLAARQQELGRQVQVKLLVIEPATNKNIRSPPGGSPPFKRSGWK
jgi:hypothetical protein